jgi:hypothetical protein
MTSNPEGEHSGTSAHVPPDSIVIGDLHVDGGHLTAELKLVLCNRTEIILLLVEPLGDEIGVEVSEAVLDYAALTIVAGHVAAKLNTPSERAALKQAAAGTAQNRRRGPQVRVKLRGPGGTSNG